MDINQAIQTLQALRSTLASTVTGVQAQVDALDVAIGQLQGTLTTDLINLTPDQKATLEGVQVTSP